MSASTLNEEIIEALKAQDPRISEVDLMLRVESELHSSVILPLLLHIARASYEGAVEEWSSSPELSPTAVLTLQRKAFLYRFVQDSLTSVLERGKIAEKSLREEHYE